MDEHLKFLGEVLIEESELQARIDALAEQISQDYAGHDLLLICILRGGVMFLTDLMRRMTIPHAIDFMAVASYGTGARQSGGSVRITLDLTAAIEDRDVLLVEDIIDSGNTIASVLELLKTRKPRSLKVCTLLDKASRREVDVPIDYRGFTIPDKFVFGYGLDLDERFRNLPFIGVVKPEEVFGPS
jgi:hypoxanthine phosphoribosyltransferase